MPRRLVLALVLLVTRSALAEPVAVAVNLPVTWRWSLAASAWIGVDDHHAIRANVARYRGPLWQIIPNLVEADGEDDEDGRIPPEFGATTDIGLGWVYYPRRVLDGPSLEAGALLRLNRLRDRIDDRNVAKNEQFTNVYSARVLLGWSWRLSDWWFVATSLGASAGYERGRQTTVAGFSFDPPMDILAHDRVSRLDVSVEAYLRVGLAFGR